MASERDSQPSLGLQQLAGWLEIDDEALWQRYVADLLVIPRAEHQLQLTGAAATESEQEQEQAKQNEKEPDENSEGGAVPRVFEAGCGPLAFLLALHTAAGGRVRVAGVDAAAEAIARVPEILAAHRWPPGAIRADAADFAVGALPDGLAGVASASRELVLSHSVFQYLTRAQVLESVEHMLRICCSRGVVFIGDVIDEGLFLFVFLFLCVHSSKN